MGNERYPTIEEYIPRVAAAIEEFPDAALHVAWVGLAYWCWSRYINYPPLPEFSPHHSRICQRLAFQRIGDPLEWHNNSEHLETYYQALFKAGYIQEAMELKRL